ncbi:MAG: transporter substrate-binding domain-containing protein [Deltaproteobacteria bacterium]|nr:transporter substrate-binding domain-containing protein [Deltaproteobacteria bacterium]
MAKYKKHLIILALLLTTPVSGQSAGDELNYFTEEFKPYNFRKGENELTGFSVDLLKLMLKEAGFTQKKIILVPWARGYDYLEKRKNTVLFTTARTNARRSLFKWACPISRGSKLAIFTSREDIPKDGIESMKSTLRLAAIREDAAWQLARAQGFTQIQTVNDPRQLVKLMNKGQVDGVAYQNQSFAQILKDMNIPDGTYRMIHTLEDIDFCYAFNIQTPDHLVSPLDQALKKIVGGKDYETLRQKYSITEDTKTFR